MIIILLIFLAWAVLVAFVITSAFLGFVVTRVPFVPTSEDDIKALVQEAGISKKDIFYDLGSGDGKVDFMVEKLTGAQTVGYELTLWTHWLANIKKYFKKSKAEFRRKNFFEESWSEATVIYCYLYPPLMSRVEEKAKIDLKPGSLVICRDFYLPNTKPDKVINRPHSHELYFYKI